MVLSDRVHEVQPQDLVGSPVLIGHSHSSLMFHAAQEVGFELRGAPFATGPQPPFSEDGTLFHPDIESSLQRGMVFSAVSRSVHDIVSIVKHPKPFDFIHPLYPDFEIDSDCELIPFDAIKETLRGLITPDLDIIAMARSIARGRLVHILSQPPLEDTELVLSLAPWPLTAGQSISKASMRLKTYLVYAELLSEWCKSRDIPVILPPSEAINERGYLKADYCSNATHANTQYGHLVLGQMKELL